MSGFLRLNTFRIFCVGSGAFLLAFALLSFGEHHVEARLAFGCLAVTLGATVLTYLVVGRLIKEAAPWKPEPMRRSEALLWWLCFAFAWLGVGLFFCYGPTTAAMELVRHALDRDYVSPFTGLELRLATSTMPIWAQAVFEIARRFALPLCLLSYLNPGSAIPRRTLATVSLTVLVLFFSFWTLDRVIPVMYVAMVYAARHFRTRQNPFTDRWLYVAVAVIVLLVVGMKNIQYGEYRPPDLAANSVISEFMGGDEGVVSSEAPAAPAQESVSEISDYLRYVVLSTVERVVFSPVAMTLYAFEQYDEHNFLHWSSTRVFSIFGIGRFVPSLEQGNGTKFHDAFPVTFLGDLWRNGGMLYMPVFGIFAGLLLLALDRAFFAFAQVPAWQTLSVFGVAFWFYGNAVNATMILLTLGSLGSLVFVLVGARLFAQMSPQVVLRGDA